jgi:lysophospholipase L1-like esterase
MKTAILIVLTVLLLTSCVKPDTKSFIASDNPNIAYSGRFDFSDPSKPVFMYSGCAIRTWFDGTSVELILKDDSLRNMFTVIIDDSLFVLTANQIDSTYLLASGLTENRHNLEIIRRTEWHGGNTTFLGLNIDRGRKIYQPAAKNRKIEFIGDSYTCGYGNEGKSVAEHFTYETENNYMSFGAITARALDAEYVAVCRSGIGIVQGYGGGRDFNMPAHYDEVIQNCSTKWDYSLYQPQLVVINLAGNDLSAPLDAAEFVNTYVGFLKRIRANYPVAAIVCVAGPSSDNAQWILWRNLIHDVVKQFGAVDKAVHYFEFSTMELHGSDWHPNVEEHQKMAGELTAFLKEIMQW